VASEVLLFVAFRNAVGVYVITLVAILASNVYFPVFPSLFSSAIIPGASAIVTILIYREPGEFFVGTQTSWIQDRRNENISEFVNAADTTECDDSNEDAEWKGEEGEESEEGEEELSPYDILGLPQDASKERIISAYRELIKQYHPDYQQGRGPKLREFAEHESQLLNWAKEEALKRF
jgi:DnaJ domain